MDAVLHGLMGERRTWRPAEEVIWMTSWWPTSAPEVIVAPEDSFGPASVRALRFVSRDLVQPRKGRQLWGRLADVLATVADVTPLSLYETTAEDVTVMHGESVHCYFLGDGQALVETVDAEGWRRFEFASEDAVIERLIAAIAIARPAVPGHWLACTLADSRDGVILSDGSHVVLGDLPTGQGPLVAPMRLSAEDVELLLLARLRIPAIA